MLDVASEKNLRKLIIAGDFFNMDSLSQYDPKQTEAGLENETAEGLLVMRSILECFDEIIYLWGNHDGRLAKALGYKLQFEGAMRLMFGELGTEALTKNRFSNLDHCWVNNDWYVCHPQAYSRNALSTAKILSTKFNANVITAHAHHCAVGYAIMVSMS